MTDMSDIYWIRRISIILQLTYWNVDYAKSETINKQIDNWTISSHWTYENRSDLEKLRHDRLEPRQINSSGKFICYSVLSAVISQTSELWIIGPYI